MFVDFYRSRVVFFVDFGISPYHEVAVGFFDAAYFQCNSDELVGELLIEIQGHHLAAASALRQVFGASEDKETLIHVFVTSFLVFGGFNIRKVRMLGE